MEVNTVHTLIAQLARTISCGGNFLLNVGPDMHGKIPAIFEDRLRELGRYTSKLHSSKLPSNRLYNPQVEAYTVVYAWILDMPTADLKLERVKTTAETIVTFLDTKVSYKPGSMQSLVIPFDKIPWRFLVRNDVMILEIKNAATQKHSPQNVVHHLKSRTYINYIDLQWTYDVF
ncbi:hypothetical protein DICVIV_08437 [Dictyocaulus viviparus]|uniref:alpha-L-fucosidase n=1 Tax=Dictyocaulus viviparus TaxID=29172 RepID=A0A0D8XLV0_DICVI|nr:hypothetical protein DICVIV_08437 [Dictyocaulus viviparus]